MSASNFKNVLLRSSNLHAIFMLGAIGLIFFSIIVFPEEGLCTTDSVRVSGQIVDPNGTPVAPVGGPVKEATVNITGWIGFQTGRLYNELIDLTTITDNQGVYEFQNVPAPSILFITVEKDGHPLHRSKLVVKDEDVEMNLVVDSTSIPHGTFTIKGKVVDNDGFALLGVAVNIYSIVPIVPDDIDINSIIVPDDIDINSIPLYYYTDEDGLYSFNNVPILYKDVESYIVVASLAGYKNDFKVLEDAETSQPYTVDLTLQSLYNVPPEPVVARVEGVVTDIHSNPISGAIVSIYPPEETIAFYQTLTGIEGKYVFPAVRVVSHEAYVVKVENENYETVSQELTLFAGQTNRLDFILESSSPIEENHAPTVFPMEPQTVNEGETIVFTILAVDTDDVLRDIVVTELPAGANFEVLSSPDPWPMPRISGKFTWTPNYDQGRDESYFVTFTVSDGELEGSTTVRIKVNDVPAPPIQTVLEVSSTDISLTITKDPSNWLTYAEAFTITNTGDSVTGWQLYNNQDGTYTPPGGTPESVVVQGFGFYDSSGGLAAGESRTVRAYINNNKPAGLYKGSYKLQEIRDGRTTDVTTIHYALEVKEAKPDLIVTDITWSPEGPEVGDEVTFQATIRNQGESFDNTFTAYIELRNIYGGIDYSDTEIVSGIPKENEAVVSFSQPWMASVEMWGNPIIVYADKDNVIDESDEANNIRSEDIFISSPSPKPDLIVVDIRQIFDPQIADVTLLEVTVKNQGQANAGRHYIRVESQHEYESFSKESPVTELSAGESKAIVIITEVHFSPGEHVVTAEEDSRNEVAESDETNNSASTTVTVVAPNMRPIADASANPTSGESPLEVQFFSDGSDDIDGEIVGYHWDFGDGEESSEEANPEYTFEIEPPSLDDYTNPGSIPIIIKFFTVTLTVTDNEGASSSDTIEIEVSASPEIPLPPLEVNIHNPKDGAVVDGSAVEVKGMVQGFVNGVEVSVNGVEAGITEVGPDDIFLYDPHLPKAFFSATIPLELGENIITVIAKDGEGREAQDAIEVEYILKSSLIVSTTDVNLTITKDPSNWLTYAEAFTITNTGDSVTGWQLYNNQDGTYTPPGGTPESVIVQGFGFYDSSGGLAAGESRTVRAYINNNKPAGLYEGSYKLQEIRNGRTIDVATIHYALEVNAQPDLVPTDITYNSVDLVEGKTVYFDSGIRNNGDEGCGVFNIRWKVDGKDTTPPAYGSHSGIPGNTTVMNGNSQFWWDAEEGMHTITFTVDDDNDTDESDETNNEKSISITVSRVNYAPEIEPIGDKEVREGERLTFTVSAEDPDGDHLANIGVVELPEGAEFEILRREAIYPNPDISGEFTWTPGYDQAGEYEVEFKVSDGKLASSETVRITVVNENLSPVAKASANPTSGESPLEVQFFSDGSYDIDGEIVGYHWDFGDGEESSEDANPEYTYELDWRYPVPPIPPPMPYPIPLEDYDDASGGWEEADGHGGIKVFTATLTVTDNDGATATDSVRITVKSPPYEPPPELEIVITDPRNGATVYDSPYTVKGIVEGIIGEITVTVNGVKAETEFFNQIQEYPLPPASAAFTAEIDLDSGENIIEAVAKDSRGMTARHEVRVVYFNENAPPVAKALANPTEGESPLEVQFSSDGSYDIDGEIVSYHWDFGDGKGSSEDANPKHTYELTGIGDDLLRPVIPMPRFFQAKLTVTDDDGAQDTDFVSITVTVPQSPLPEPPPPDPEPPIPPEPRLEIRITEPEDGAIIHTSPIEVRGEVTGIFHPGLRVYVNGVRAKIRYKGYSFPLRRRKAEFIAEVSLRPRRNTITAVAVNRYGAEARDEIHVLYESNRRF